MVAVQKSSMAVCFYSMESQAVSRRDEVGHSIIGIYPTKCQLEVERKTRAVVDLAHGR
jgi:hypothetical protein